MVNDRFLKFTYEKNNIKTKFTTNNVIHVLFYSENNLLLSKVLEKDKDLLNFFNKTIINKSASTFLVRAEKGNFLLIRRKTKIDDLKQKYLQDLGGAIFNKIKSIGCSEVKFYEDNSKILEQLCLGVLLSSYKFDNYKMVKSKEINDLKKITVVTEQNENFSKMFEEIKNLAQGVFRARDLVWQPPNILYPSTFADECKKLKKIGLKVNVYNEQQLDKMGMSALLAVGRGSRKDSKVVVMEWLGGKKNTPPMAFIGKGVCFDSGGLSLKPPKSMEDMKWDMGGAATVTGLLESVALSKLKFNVIGVLGLVENMPDGDAQRPGDVVKSVSGQTIEVLNTDAEGRLVLADLLSWTEKKYKPKFMINLATLTGAMIVALGNIRAGLFSNDEKISKAIFDAGESTGEKVWAMPLDDDYDQLIKTEIADMKNIGGPGAGSITAACFLKRHVEKTPWAHLDIAGVTWKNKSTPSIPYGGVGWGVRMLYHMIKQH
ncbi:MAG: leucyl aminopeptidase [Alphaproteobacteria bacterium]|jgi:leucyl aminopeptidase|nr:leucyl aminopeptidase [Alphaproteobacteria bacterium]